jgi:hypothetical protein
MKNLFSKILNSKLFRTILILIVILTLVGFGVNKYLDMKADLAISEQNKAALADSLRVSQNKLGDLVFSKQILVAKNTQDLKDLNEELLDVVKNFDGKIHQMSRLIAQIDNEPVVITDTKFKEYPDGTKAINWELNEVYDEENSRKLAGESKFKFDTITRQFTPLETIINEDKIRFNLDQGLRTTTDGKIEMFASSKYPGFSALDLNSVILDPKTHPVLKKFTRKKKVAFGIYVGAGVNTNITDFTMTLGPQVGVGLMYILW